MSRSRIDDGRNDKIDDCDECDNDMENDGKGNRDDDDRANNTSWCTLLWWIELPTFFLLDFLSVF